MELLNLLNYSSSKITEHFVARAKQGWETARKTRRQREAEELPKDVSISEAIRMHSGNVRVKGGMISGNAGAVEKMITRSYFRCGYCDTINQLLDYRDSRARFKHEVPATLGKKGKPCFNCSERFGHELDYDVTNALRIELQDMETFSDLERLSIVLFDDSTKNVSIGEQVIVTGSIHKIAMHNTLRTFVFASSIEYVNRKESIELSETDIKEIQGLAKTTTLVDEKTGKEKKITVLDKLVSKLAPSVIGNEYVKKCLLFCAANSGKDSFHRRRRLNALLIGETGLDKSQLLNHAARLVPKSRFTSATTSSVRSLIGVVDKESDNPFLRLGPIPSASGAICAIDEIGRMSYEDQAQILNALQEGRIPFGKHGFNLYLDGSATFILSANPNNSSGEWKDPETIDLNEIPLLGPLRDRVDLIFDDALKTMHDEQKRLRFVNRYHSNNNERRLGIIDWIEKLLRIPLHNFRKYCIWRILVPYLINIKGVAQPDAFKIIKSWLDKCNSVRNLDFNARQKINEAFHRVMNYRNISLNNLKKENTDLYNLLQAKGVI
jgi:DNA replicative helicase MCM subunit Mcm2 (Cdc46/Mcm family)